MISLVAQLSPHTGKKTACEALQVPRATFYRHHCTNSRSGNSRTHRPAPPLALSSGERQAVIDVLHSDQFCDDAPHQVYAKLLDAGRYLCSVRTMYRILETEHGNVKERRKHVQRPQYVKPELLATQPSLVVGHYQTQRSGKMDLLLPVCDNGYLQPLCGRLDDRSP